VDDSRTNANASFLLKTRRGSGRYFKKTMKKKRKLNDMKGTLTGKREKAKAKR
jgi:hypothetical protein